MWVEVWGCLEVLGKVWESVLECGGDMGKCVGEMWESVLVCGGGRGRCGEVSGEVREGVLGVG